VATLAPVKAGEGNPQAREEEGKRLLGLERSSSLAGISGIWGLKFHGKAATFTSTVGSYLDFNLTYINEDVLEEIYIVFNVTTYPVYLNC